jgi:hypothetical protein
MIGKVVFPFRSGVAEAVMDDDGCWRCDAAPCLARPLNCLHSTLWYGETVDQSKTMRCLESAARWLHGVVDTGRRERDESRGDQSTFIRDLNNSRGTSA